VQYSWLWGKGGELWSPTGRLADWSYVGYMGRWLAVQEQQHCPLGLSPLLLA
jgi:hypothetical protein